MGAPRGSLGAESGSVATVPLAQIGDYRGIDRNAAEIVQQHAAMSRRIGADAVKAQQVIVVQPLGPAFARWGDRAVIKHLSRRCAQRARAEPELSSYSEPLLAIIE